MAEAAAAQTQQQHREVLALGTQHAVALDDLHLAAEATSFAACAATTDFAEGIGAFIEKRPARFGESS